MPPRQQCALALMPSFGGCALILLLLVILRTALGTGNTQHIQLSSRIRGGSGGVGGTGRTTTAPRRISGIKGASAVEIHPKYARAAGHQGAIQTDAPLTLWCSALDDQYQPLEMESASFHRSGGGGGRAHQRYPPATRMESSGGYVLTLSRTNATLVKESVSIDDAGVWTCNVKTKFGNASGDIRVWVRPLVYGNGTLRIDEVNASQHHYSASGVTVVEGNEARLECPVFGLPKPRIFWKLGSSGKPIEPSGRIQVNARDGYSLTIQNVSYADDDTYTCVATNAFTTKNHPATLHYNLTVDRRLRVKSKFAWLPPLVIIIVTVILLATIIILCEARKKRNERKQLLNENDED